MLTSLLTRNVLPNVLRCSAWRRDHCRLGLYKSANNLWTCFLSWHSQRRLTKFAALYYAKSSRHSQRCCRYNFVYQFNRRWTRICRQSNTRVHGRRLVTACLHSCRLATMSICYRASCGRERLKLLVATGNTTRFLSNLEMTYAKITVSSNYLTL